MSTYSKTLNDFIGVLTMGDKSWTAGDKAAADKLVESLANRIAYAGKRAKAIETAAKAVAAPKPAPVAAPPVPAQTPDLAAIVAAQGAKIDALVMAMQRAVDRADVAAVNAADAADAKAVVVSRRTQLAGNAARARS